MTALLQVLIKSRLTQAMCCLSPSITIWANRMCAGMSVNDDQMYASLLIRYLLFEIKEIDGQLETELTEEEIFCIFDKLADLLCMRYNLCISNDNLVTSEGDVIQWVDLDSIDDNNNEAYLWNN